MIHTIYSSSHKNDNMDDNVQYFRYMSADILLSPSYSSLEIMDIRSMSMDDCPTM